MNFSALISCFERIEATSKRLEMFDILADLFRLAEPSEIDKIIYLSQGQLLPPYRGLETGMSAKLMLRAVADASGHSVAEAEKTYDKGGDIGDAAEKLLSRRRPKQPASLFDAISEPPRAETVSEVYAILREIAETSGAGSVERKISLASGLLSAVTPVEAKHVSRFVVGKLRLGIGDPTVLEALAITHGGREHKPELERAYNICCDLGLVATTLLNSGMDGVNRLHIRAGTPIRMALCERVNSADEIIAKMGSAAVEAKYDGFRVQAHKTGSDVEMFSRNLERTTGMFPEITDALRAHLKAESAVIEGEAMAFDEITGELLPFQVTIQRKRKHDIGEMAGKFPLRFYAFDLLFLNGEDLTGLPFVERRKLLESVIVPNSVITTSEMFITDRPEDITRAFESAIGRGLEGLVVKRPDSGYSAGARNFNWIKLKRSYRAELSDSVDLCIVGYYLGRGSRARFGIGGVLAAVYDEDADLFRTVTKIGSGFSEDELADIKKMLDAIALPHRHPRVDSAMDADVWVEPRFVIKVTADELTRSQLHTAGRDETGTGFALRFPRFVGELRTDKRPEDATTVREIVRLYEMQGAAAPDNDQDKLPPASPPPSMRGD